MPETDTPLEAELRARIREQHKTLESWRDVAALPEYKANGIPAGTLCTIAKDGPIPFKHRENLGLLPMKRTSVCPECGEVHTKKHPHPRARSPRVAIRKDDPESAWNSLVKNLPTWTLLDLATRFETWRSSLNLDVIEEWMDEQGE